MLSYQPPLTPAENLRITELMTTLQKVQATEEAIKKELRTLVYKIEKGR